MIPADRDEEALMILSTTSNIDGYVVKNYFGLSFGTDIYLVGGLLGGGLANQEKLFSAAYNRAVSHLLSNTKASFPDANAIIGISTSVSSPGTTADIIVIVTGTAVEVQSVESVEAEQRQKKAIMEAEARRKKEWEEKLKAERERLELEKLKKEEELKAEKERLELEKKKRQKEDLIAKLASGMNYEDNYTQE